MKKSVLFAATLCAVWGSNYKIVPLSPEGLALSGSNIAKSFSADAAVYNPANMAFLGDKAQLLSSSSLYHVGGATFDNELDNSLNSTNPDAYANSQDAKGEDYNFGLGVLALVLPINEKHFLGLALYTDMAAVYGWQTPYAKMLVNHFDIRSGTAALSYAYKPLNDLSLAATLTVNHAKIKYNLIKDQAKNPRYFGNPRVCLQDGSCSVADVINHYYGEPDLDDTKDYTNLAYTPHYVYSGDFSGDNSYPVGYKLSATYSPDFLDNKLNLSLVYTSKYNSDFSGNIAFDMSRWTMVDFILDALENYQDAMGQLPLADKQELAEKVLKPLFINFADESEQNRGRIDGPGGVSLDYPASIAAGVSYTEGSHSFMFNYAHTFWSKVNNLQISLDYTPQIVNPLVDTSLLDVLLAYFVSTPNRVEWKDTDLFAIGYRYDGEKWSFMGGFATEDTPLSRKQMTFMSKDARVYQFSIGAEYRASQKLSLELAFAHQHFATVKTDYVDDVLIKSKGRFHGQSNQIASFGVKYKF